MSDPFIGEIRMFGFNWAPRGWASCNGQILPIQQNAALYSLLSTQFGGDGKVNFGLPDFRGRMPLHPGSGMSQGEKGGAETVAVSSTNVPPHTHTMVAVSTTGTQVVLQPPVVFAGSQEPTYIAAGTYVAMHPGTCSITGGSQPHNNIQPSLCIGFCIALSGMYPSRN